VTMRVGSAAHRVWVHDQQTYRQDVSSTFHMGVVLYTSCRLKDKGSAMT